MILARNLLTTLRDRELAQAAREIAAKTGLEHRPVLEGLRVAGIYRRSIMFASGRYAVLDDGVGFRWYLGILLSNRGWDSRSLPACVTEVLSGMSVGCEGQLLPDGVLIQLVRLMDMHFCRWSIWYLGASDGLGLNGVEGARLRIYLFEACV